MPERLIGLPWKGSGVARLPKVQILLVPPMQNKDPQLCSEKSEYFAKIVCDENEKFVLAYKAGQVELMEYFVGQVMIKSKGSVNPKFARNAIEKEINGS